MAKHSDEVPGILENIPTDCIRADASINPRAGGCDPLTVEEYTVAWEAGDTFPPLVVYRDAEGTTWLSEGFHRLEAARLADGIDSVPCEVREGGRREALLHAVGSNATHGKRRTNEDKRRAVELLLADPEWAKKSDRWIAERCAVSNHFVATIRRWSTGNIPSSREGKDGKVRNLPTAAVPSAEPDDEPDDGDEPDCDALETAEPSVAELTRAVAEKAASVGDSWEAEAKAAKRTIGKTVRQCVQGRDDRVRAAVSAYLVELSESL